MARVLVIEDNWANLELMSYLLKAHGHEVSSARDGEEGVAQARSERPELIICDIHLPRMDGYQVARQIKETLELQHAPLIAVTALAMVGDREKVLEGGFDGYIAKPIVPETFVAQIEAFLGIPARAAPSAAPPAAREEKREHAPKNCTILILDDVAANLDVIRHTLEPFGYAVQIASTVSEALDLARRSPPDLILSDLHLRGEHGHDLFHAVKADARLSAIPFVFITSSVLGVKDRDAALELGADHFLIRPIAPEVLLEEVQACLAQRQSKAAN